jgi:serine/threonine protein kinase/tetratricopeptide (TPR) repeat protein
VISALEPLAAALAERYRLEREIGRGGMAIVYLAEDCKHHRQVALKILRPEVAASLGVERFLREIEIASHLAHPHILPVHDSGEAAGFLYYVMPYVQGETLRDRLVRETQLPIEDALQIAREVADALGYAHSLGVVHRDIKPENVLFEAGHAVISDFGIARAISEAGGEHLTQPGFSVGTPMYMSPEQATGDRAVDGRSDIYSLGCVLYEMLVGEPPYTGPTAQVVIAKQLTDPVPAVRRLRETVPAGVELALSKALAKVPADRFVTAGAFSDALAKPAPVAAGPRSVAVLPFLNFSADPENEYFADGMTEDVIAQLSKIRSLKVISRTSVMSFKKREQSLQEIATKLRVATLLEGSIRRAGDRVRIVAQLIDAETDQHLWAETYDRDLTDIFAIQGDVASHIAAALDAELSPAEETRLRKKPTGNLEAYHLCLKGRHCLLRYTSEGIRQGLEYLDQAIAKDPSYALAYTNVALTYVAVAMGYGAGTVPAEEAYRRAKEAAETALKLDEELGEAHASLAFVKFVLEFDWAGAEREFGRAWELNPGTGTMGEMLRDMHGLMLSALERYDDAIAMFERAQELDPLSAVHATELATTLVRAGRYDEAIREAKRLVELQPDFPMGHSSLGWAYLQKGRYDEGLAELTTALSLSPGNTMLLAQLGQAYGVVGNVEEARRVLQQLEALSRGRYVSPYHMAYVHTGLGEQDEAIDCLEQAYEERSGGVYGVKGSYLFTTLRPHPRFKALLRKMNLE